MENIFDTDGFMLWLKEEFPGCIDNHWSFNLVENIIGYCIKHNPLGKDQLAYWISDMLPEVEFLEVAKFVNDDFLTDTTLNVLGRK